MADSKRLVILFLVLNTALGLAAMGDPNAMIKIRKGNYTQHELRDENRWRWTQSKADRPGDLSGAAFRQSLLLDA